MTDLSGRKPILCLDFDGVCHSYTSGWKGAAVIPDPPVDGMWDFLASATEAGFEINIFSSRTHQEGGKTAMKRWFLDHCPQHDRYIGAYQMLVFPEEKPPALVGIDDRVLTFTGVWPNPTDLLRFKPWNAHGRPRTDRTIERCPASVPQGT